MVWSCAGLLVAALTRSQFSTLCLPPLSTLVNSGQGAVVFSNEQRISGMTEKYNRWRNNVLTSDCSTRCPLSFYTKQYKTAKVILFVHVIIHDLMMFRYVPAIY